MKKWILLVSIILISGCSLNANITNLNEERSSPPTPSNQINKITSLENVSGSTGYVTTLVSGYKVKQSAGLLLNKQVATTPNGYKVYLHAAGRITSEE